MTLNVAFKNPGSSVSMDTQHWSSLSIMQSEAATQSTYIYIFLLYVLRLQHESDIVYRAEKGVSLIYSIRTTTLPAHTKWR